VYDGSGDFRMAGVAAMSDRTSVKPGKKEEGFPTRHIGRGCALCQETLARYEIQR